LSYAPLWGMAIGLEYFGGGKPTADYLLYPHSPPRTSRKVASVKPAW